MIPIYICDDEKPVADRLEHIISNQITILNGDMGPVREADTPERLLDLQTKDTIPAVYFLDIDFPGRMSGLELAQKLRLHEPRGFIVFITAHHDLAFETFRLRLEALDYIVKGDYNAMAVRVRECLTSIQQRLASEQPKHGRYCTIRLFDTIRHIPVETILYFEALGFKHTLCLHLDNELLEFNSSLEHFAEELGEDFWRCHRGFLVNRSRIRTVDLKCQAVILDNGTECPLSRRAKTEYNAQRKRDAK